MWNVRPFCLALPQQRNLVTKLRFLGCRPFLFLLTSFPNIAKVFKIWSTLADYEEFAEAFEPVRIGEMDGMNNNIIYHYTHFSLRGEPLLISPRNDVWEASAEISYWWCFTTQIWEALQNCLKVCFHPIRSTKHYSELRSDTSSDWNFCGRSPEVILRGKQWWRSEMSALLSDLVQMIKSKAYFNPSSYCVVD